MILSEVICAGVLCRSREAGLLVSRLAASVIEVEPELQGNLVVAFDPLSVAPCQQLAASTFGVWRR